MPAKSMLSIFFVALVVLAMICAISAEYAQVPYRQTAAQRENYRHTASDRYSQRLTDRAKSAESAASFTPISTRPPFIADYSKQRDLIFNNEYSANRVDTSIKLTPREEYLQKWKTLPSSTQQQLNDKRNKLQSMLTNAPDSWVSMKTPDFIEFALRGPRPYWLWLTLTVLDSSAHCPTCTTYHSYWKTVTPGFQEAARNDKNDPTPMIMALVLPTEANEIWRALKLNRAPASVLLPPDFDLGAKIDIQNVMESGVLRQTMMMNPALEDLINPLESNGFPVKLPPPPQPGILLLSFAFALIAGLMYTAYLFFPYLSQIQQHRAVFLIIVLVFYLYAAAGGGFVKSTKPPMTGYQPGKDTWIHREYTQMYGIELYLLMFAHGLTAFGLWCGALSLAPLGLTQRELNVSVPVSFEHDNAGNTAVGEGQGQGQGQGKTVVTSLDSSTRFERRIAYRLFSYVAPDFLFAVGFGLFFVGYYAILSTFTIKMPSYPFGF